MRVGCHRDPAYPPATLVRVRRLVLGRARVLACAAAPASRRAARSCGRRRRGRREDARLRRSPKANDGHAQLAGFDAIRITQIWATGQTALGAERRSRPRQRDRRRAVTGIRVVLVAVYSFGSSDDAADRPTSRPIRRVRRRRSRRRYPVVHDFIVGNEPNSNRFWLPQFAPDGTDAAAPAYEQLLATTYDALKAVRPHSTVIGGALAPRGVDRPDTGRDTHSPTAFITDLGAAYRASGAHGCRSWTRSPSTPTRRTRRPPPNVRRTRTRPRSASPTTRKLVGLLGAAFDGTAQRGSTLPIVYGEYGIETRSRPAKAPLYIGTRARDDEAGRRGDAGAGLPRGDRSWPSASRTCSACCSSTSTTSRPGGLQTGVFYVDGTPKASLGAVRAAAPSACGEVIAAACAGLQLTPKLKLTRRQADEDRRAGDAHVLARLHVYVGCGSTARSSLTGNAVGDVAKTLRFTGALGARAGTRSPVSATAALNTGPPGSDRANVPLEAASTSPTRSSGRRPSGGACRSRSAPPARTRSPRSVEEFGPRFDAPARLLDDRRPARLRLLPLEDHPALRGPRRARRGAERDAARRLARRRRTRTSRRRRPRSTRARARPRKIIAEGLAVPRRLPVREGAALVRRSPRRTASARWTSTCASAHEFPTIHNHTTYSFGIDDQEFMTAFECDEPADFMHLMLTLRESEASRYTERDTPIFVGQHDGRSARRSTGSTASRRASKIAAERPS